MKVNGGIMLSVICHEADSGIGSSGGWRKGVPFKGAEYQREI